MKLHAWWILASNVPGCCVIAIMGAVLLTATHGLAAELPPTKGRTNLAAGQTVMFSPAPNCRLTQRNDSDPTDLTDGNLTQRADRHIWFDSTAVGWSYGGRVNLAVDLGRVSRIDEIAMRLLGGSPQAGSCMYSVRPWEIFRWSKAMTRLWAAIRLRDSSEAQRAISR